MLTLTTFRSVPPFAAGYVRDLRVRWALEEAGLPYELRLLDFQDAALPAYRKEQPFSQIPMLQDGDLRLFESGAILLHLAQRCPLLLPQDAHARAQVTVWMFAALNSVEPYLAELVTLNLFHGDEDWAAGARPAAEEMVRKRLRDLDDWLEGRGWLAGEFSAADILMTTVLRLLDGMELVERHDRLRAYRDRCMDRPAFGKALADQLALYGQAPRAA
ncbi:glutathione S-transferase family protein [Massilia sp. G4R7]|uniref:Glutathione S-transferase family protein n=1 Tax=Massilia phyllostachyos TaxID=2898585 RepID=A0ABS8Q996_9BURK|nr:glutathione S-transferase family protein [Massilia phyllostachyos]MCD2518322.1 glutathione S-transferase family protein [Massilia phyllostachyos]